MLISRLHSNPMDIDRPLWEIHLIEGLHGGRFAMYGKLHHSLADGVSGVGLVNFSETRRRAARRRSGRRSARASRAAARRRRRPRRAAGGAARARRRRCRACCAASRVRPRRRIGLKADPDFASLAEAPRTIFNTNVTPQRRVATQATSLARMKAIGEAAGGSVNDVLLAACSGALRRYLAEIDKLPRKSLIASIPVALPRDTSQAGGNAISFANVQARAPTSRTCASAST